MLTPCCLTGTLPASWAQLSKMSFLSLGQNNLSGTLPSEWGSGSWPQMYNLNLTQNQVWPQLDKSLLTWPGSGAQQGLVDKVAQMHMPGNMHICTVLALWLRSSMLPFCN